MVQAVEELDRTDRADEGRHQSSWVAEGNCHNEEDHLAEDMVGVVELACADHRTEVQGFVAAAACCDACRCLDDHTGHQPVEARKGQLACHQERRLRDLHYVLHRLKQRGHRSAP